MNILWLGPHRQNMIDSVTSGGDKVVHTEKRITKDSAILKGINFIISYGYQYIIKDNVLTKFPRRVINMHISYLPWNKGKDPNMWSFLEDTPKGVTIHFIDPGIDTGEIIAQEKVDFKPNDTLRTSYTRLSTRIEQLFAHIWPEIKNCSIKSFAQQEEGSFHLAREKQTVEKYLHSGWDTPVVDLIGKRSKAKCLSNLQE